QIAAEMPDRGRFCLGVDCSPERRPAEVLVVCPDIRMEGVGRPGFVGFCKVDDLWPITTLHLVICEVAGSPFLHDHTALNVPGWIYRRPAIPQHHIKRALVCERAQFAILLDDLDGLVEAPCVPDFLDIKEQ